MLCEPKVENLALIELLHLSLAEPGPGALVVMTGETGARASVDWIRSGAEQCSVEALFEIDEQRATLLQLLEQGGFAGGNEVITKRIIDRFGDVTRHRGVDQRQRSLLELCGQDFGIGCCRGTHIDKNRSRRRCIGNSPFPAVAKNDLSDH